MSSDIDNQDILEYLNDALKSLENETDYLRKTLQQRQEQITYYKKIIIVLEVAKAKGAI